MNSFGFCLVLVCLFVVSGCSDGNKSSSTSVVSASQVEIAKLQAAIKADPTYKIENSEIALLQNAGILTEADKAQLQAIK